jgi:hypothetical protein
VKEKVVIRLDMASKRRGLFTLLREHKKVFLELIKHAGNFLWHSNATKLRLRENALALQQTIFMLHVDVPPREIRAIAMFFLFHLRTIFHTGYVDMFIDYHCNGMTLVTAIKPKAIERLPTTAILPFYILQKQCPEKTCMIFRCLLI